MSRVGSVRGLLAAVSLAVGSLIMATPASAAQVPANISNARLIVTGGNTTAISQCVNSAKSGTVTQVNQCENAGVAQGGAIELKDVNALVVAGRFLDKDNKPVKNPVTRLTGADLTVTGGNTTAIAQCVNDAKDGTVTQINMCNNTAVAVGAPITLTNVNVVVGKVL